MERSILEVVSLYNPASPLEEAWTIPAPWYFDPRIAALERASVFSSTWQVVGRVDEVRHAGHFLRRSWRGNPLSLFAETTASFAPFTTFAAIMQPRSSPIPMVTPNNSAAPIMAGPTASMAR